MSDDSRRVLDLLAQGKITVSEAEQLLQALNGAAEKQASASEAETKKEGERATPRRYLCIAVEPSATGGGRHKGPVNIRLPLGFLRSGIKLAAIMPDSIQARLVSEHLRKKGIDFDTARLKPEQMDAIIAALGDLNLDVDSDRGKVRIFCE